MGASIAGKGRTEVWHNSAMRPADKIQLSPGKRVLYLTKDAALIRAQLAGELTLRADQLNLPDDLLDDINTDVMTPAWVCFNYKPEDIARDAYAGLIVDGERVFERDALTGNNFEVIVSGFRKGTGSSRETAVQAEKWGGIRIAVAESFAPIHERNNINQGVLMTGYEVLRRLEDGEEVPLWEFYADYDPVTQLIVQHGGLFPFAKALAAGEISVPVHVTGARPMNMTEKVLARHLVSEAEPYVKPGDAVLVEVDGGYSHDFTSAQVHHFLEQVQARSPRAFRGLRGPSRVRRRGREAAALPAPDRHDARHATTLSGAHARHRLPGRSEWRVTGYLPRGRA